MLTYMTKTLEQMALEYIKDVETARNPSVTATAFPQMRRCFLAGYQAAKDEEEMKDHDANTSKLIKPTNTVGKEELNCMIAHFENEDYKISVMVPGILPKDDGGELVCGCGLIVYDIWKKVA